jgi:KipI family sensor histidine kinase inhibitor
VQRLAAAVRARAVPGVLDVVPALGGLALHFDAAFEGDIVAAAAAIVAETKKLPDAGEVGREVEVPVCYDEEFAPDLAEVATKTKLSWDEVRKLHAAGEYRVLMIGFAPGHAYLGGLDAKLAVPRRATPRPSVPAGSVAIANRQTVVYPYAISGGWSVIGRTPLVLFDAGRSRPSLFGPADRVRFVAIPKNVYLEMAAKQ